MTGSRYARGNSHVRLNSQFKSSPSVSSLDIVPLSEQCPPRMSTARNLSDVLRAARQIAAERGKASQLAKFAKVSRSRVSEWLSGEAKPDGEAALKLLAWVEEEQRKQESADSVQAPPTPKTRQRKVIKHENKPTSSRGKK